ncbi:hypothetical protein MNBD_PLANCTO03-926 [hydrothermal vent metagenome]|uniref:Thioredoxin family protein n=1 Tax=hydrothermal vent metagenome TaxID=652676 RepID=A0A3B1E6Q9_9ZZZZ
MQHDIVSNGTAPGGMALRAVWPSTGTTQRVEVLGFGGCPNTPKMRDRVAEAVGALGSGYVLVEVDQESLAADDLRRGYPAPTVLVDGVDLFGLPAPSSLAMGCRVYPGGLPSAEEIQSRLAAFGGDG